MDADTIRRRIAEFPTWHYQFDLKGNITPINKPARLNGHEQRKRYFFDPMVRLLGGSLAGKTVLDLGCNAGYWSLAAANAGADFVFGVDGRAMHIDQANLVFEASDVDSSKYEFVEANIYDLDLDRYGPFDVVLCLGLLYHVAKPLELIERISGWNRDVLLIDTMLSVAPGSYLRMRAENPDLPLNAVEQSLVVSPTKEALVRMARSAGYDVAVLKPAFSDYRGAKKYRQGRRKAFLCAKETPLSSIDVSVEDNVRSLSTSEYAYLVSDNLQGIRRRLARS